MDAFVNLLAGFEVSLSAVNLFYCFVGVFVGTFVGVLPGIGGLSAIAMLLPLTFHLETTTAIIMLSGIFYGSQYGGSTASILLNLPGTASNAVTCLEGYPMAKKGKAGLALFLAAIGSFVGGSLGILALVLLAPAIAQAALAFGPIEYFAVLLLGLALSATISRGAPLDGFAMVLLGVLFGSVGIDVNTGAHRFTLGLLPLTDGISVVAIAMGVFGIAEVAAAIKRPERSLNAQRITLRSMLPSKSEFKQSIAPTLRGTAIGGTLGSLPGVGMMIATFVSYAVEKRISSDKSRFGNGAIEGLVSPETANNAAAQTSFIPTLTLGIPGDVTMALILGALMLHGIPPGPGLINNHPELFWGLVASFWIGNVLLLILNIPMIGIWVRLLLVPYRILYPSIIVLVCIGVFSIRYNSFDVGVVLFFGLIGYAMRVFELEAAPLLIGFVLGPMIEENFRRAMLLSQGSYLDLLTNPVAGSVFVIVLLLVVWGVASTFVASRVKPASENKAS